jgi:hypothetical protein
MDVIPLSSTASDGTAAACAGCGAPLAADQRYCLACGRPCSPVRLAFLDVLQAEHRPGGVGDPFGSVLPAGYPPLPEPDGMLGSLRRYSGLFGLLAVLLASLLIGLLVGHWLTGGASTGKQVYEIKGLPALAAAPGVGSTGSGSSGSGSSGSGSSPGSGSSSSTGHNSSNSSQSHASAKSEQAEEAEEAKEVKTTTEALPKANKTSSSTLHKLEHTTGKQHAKEVAKLGNAPIETH